MEENQGDPVVSFIAEHWEWLGGILGVLGMLIFGRKAVESDRAERELKAHKDAQEIRDRVEDGREERVIELKDRGYRD